MKKDNLLVNTVKGFYELVRSRLSLGRKLHIGLAGVMLTVRYYLFHRFKKQGVEHILGFSIYFFDYGLLHFQFREIFLKNEYYFISQKKQPVYFDCGANIGMTSIYVKWLYPYSVIYAFEPDLETFTLLKKNIRENAMADVHLFNVALSDTQGTTSFYVDKNKPGWLTMSLFKNQQLSDRIQIRKMPLSYYLSNKTVDFMSLDIEGAESMVIQELHQKNILRNIQTMVIEYHYGQPDSRQKLKKLLTILKENLFHIRQGRESAKDLLIYAKQ